jgi:hypothetical protein
LFFRANPPLPWYDCQATSHVTSRRFAHARFTSTSTSFILTSAHPFRLGRARPQSRGCRERQFLAGRIRGTRTGSGGRNGLLLSEQALMFIILVLNISVIVTAGTGQLTKPYETPLGLRPEDIRLHFPPFTLFNLVF